MNIWCFVIFVGRHRSQCSIPPSVINQYITSPHNYNNLVIFYLTTKIFIRNNLYGKKRFPGQLVNYNNIITVISSKVHMHHCSKTFFSVFFSQDPAIFLTLSTDITTTPPPSYRLSSVQ